MGSRQRARAHAARLSGARHDELRLRWSIARADNTFPWNSTGAFSVARGGRRGARQRRFEHGLRSSRTPLAGTSRLPRPPGWPTVDRGLDRRPGKPLFEFTLAVERIRAARRAIDDSARAFSSPAVPKDSSSVARISPRHSPADRLRRCRADCLYAPGIRAMPDIVSVVEAVAPKPVNVLASTDFATVSELAAAGVRRISVGGAWPVAPGLVFSTRRRK